MSRSSTSGTGPRRHSLLLVVINGLAHPVRASGPCMAKMKAMMTDDLSFVAEVLVDIIPDSGGSGMRFVTTSKR